MLHFVSSGFYCVNPIFSDHFDICIIPSMHPKMVITFERPRNDDSSPFLQHSCFGLLCPKKYIPSRLSYFTQLFPLERIAWDDVESLRRASHEMLQSAAKQEAPVSPPQTSLAKNIKHFVLAYIR